MCITCYKADQWFYGWILQNNFKRMIGYWLAYFAKNYWQNNYVANETWKNI